MPASHHRPKRIYSISTWRIEICAETFRLYHSLTYIEGNYRGVPTITPSRSATYCTLGAQRPRSPIICVPSSHRIASSFQPTGAAMEHFATVLASDSGRTFSQLWRLDKPTAIILDRLAWSGASGASV